MRLLGEGVRKMIRQEVRRAIRESYEFGFDDWHPAAKALAQWYINRTIADSQSLPYMDDAKPLGALKSIANAMKLVSEDFILGELKNAFEMGARRARRPDLAKFAFDFCLNDLNQMLRKQMAPRDEDDYLF